MSRRGSNFNYGFDCEDCGGWVSGRARNKLAGRRMDRTLCLDCIEAADRAKLERYWAVVEAKRQESERLAAERAARRADYRLELNRRQREKRAAKRMTEPPRRGYVGPPRTGYVYRLRDANGRLLYVGKTYSVPARLFDGPTSHSQTKTWWGDVVTVEVTAYRTEADALAAEAWAIKREEPIHNIDRPSPRTKRAPKRLHTYSGAVAA